MNLRYLSLNFLSYESFQFFSHHVAVLPHVYGHLVLFAPQLISNGRNHRLFEEDFRSRGVSVLDGFRDFVVPEPHGPIEIIFVDVTFDEEVSEISHIPLH